jgi:hypothetical protein
MAANKGYIARGTTQLEIALPAIVPQYTRFKVVADNGNGWKITQKADQTIKYLDNNVTTTGVSGYVDSSTEGAGIEILCLTPNTDFRIIDHFGGKINII